MSCKCKSGVTEIDFLTLIPGGTAASSSYLVSLTHHNCGGRRMCTNSAYPVGTNLQYQVIGEPFSVGNGNFCCKVLCTGTITFLPFCGYDCKPCPVTDNIYFTMNVPCSSTETPTITPGDVTATPKVERDCCTFTDSVNLLTSFQVATS